MKKRTIISVVIVFMILLTAVNSVAGDSLKTISTGQTADSSALNGQKLSIAFSNDSGYSVTDSYGNVWTSGVSEEAYDYSTLNESWKKNFKSFLTIYYADISDVNPSIKTAFSSDAEITAQTVGSQLLVTLNFPGNIELTVVAEEKDGLLCFSIPADKIKEETKNKLISVDFMPYMGSASGDENGYFFYPDGSGAITYFKNSAAETLKNQIYSWDVYGHDFSDIDTLRNAEDSDQMSAMLPVFGVSKETGGFICFSDTGEAESKISMAPANSGIGLNRIYFSFVYRTAYTIAMSNIDIGGTATAKDINGKMYNESIFAVDHSVNYLFLDESQNNYSGMANAYRNYLITNGLLNKQAKKSPMYVDLFLSAKQESVFSSSLAKLTDYKQAKVIMDYFSQKDCNQISYTLLGWSKGGYGCVPQSLSVTAALGGKAAADALLKDSRVILAFDGFWAKKENGSFSAKKDTVKNGNQNAVTDAAEQSFLLNDAFIQKSVQNLLTKYGNKGCGFYFEQFGVLLYRDFSENNIKNREDMKAAVINLLESAAAHGTVSVEGANLYTLKDADCVRKLPSDSSEYYITDQTVPFLQMVLHGSVDYTATAGNLSSDFDTCLLRWIELGCVPYFELTYENSDELKYTDYNTLFTSQYENHAEDIEQAYNAYGQLSDVINQPMVFHEHIGDVATVVYEDGTKIVLNYGNAADTVDGIQVEAKSYRVIGATK